MGEREGYPEDVLRRLQQVELEMLRRIDRACRAIGVSYWLDSGTCLGAVRHGGFIPWDDDIDIGMPLDDYLRFLEEAPAVLGEGLSLHTCDNTPNLPVLWAKIYLDGTRFNSARDIEAGLEQGIFVDVFPYVNVDERPEVAERQHRRLALCQNLSYLNVFAHPATYRYSKNARLARLVCEVAHATVARPFTPSRMARKAARIARVERPGDEWRPLFAFANLKQSLPTKALLPTRPIEFEGETFMGPADPDLYLRTLYGSYMKLPPEDRRHTHTPEVLDFGDGVNLMD